MLLAARAAALAPRLPSMARSATRSTVRMDAATPEQFARIDLRVGTIVDAFNHPESEKLIVEEIDLGEPDGPRQIVSGLQDFYKASELVGKKVLVVANLPTAKLGGMPSAGMVLCGSMDEKAKVEVLEPPAACEDGEPAYLEGVDADLATPNQVKKKKLWAPVAAELKLVGGVATFDGKPIETSEGTWPARRSRTGRFQTPIRCCRNTIAFFQGTVGVGAGSHRHRARCPRAFLPERSPQRAAAPPAITVATMGQLSSSRAAIASAVAARDHKDLDGDGDPGRFLVTRRQELGTQ